MLDEKVALLIVFNLLHLWSKDRCLLTLPQSKTFHFLNGGENDAELDWKY